MFNSLKLALQFLTVLPVKVEQTGESWEKAHSRSLVWYPLVGGILGVLVAAAFLLFRVFTDAAVAAVMALAVEFWLTSGLHADGFIDTVDGFFNPYDRERKLDIMRDSRTGALGVVGFALLLLLKFSLFSSLTDGPAPAFLLILGYAASRWILGAVVVVYPYAREEGLGSLFCRQMGRLVVAKSSLVMICLMIGGGIVAWRAGVGWDVLSPGRLLAVVLAPWAIVAVTARKITDMLGGLTGDVYGALAEISLVVALLVGIMGL